MKIELRGIKYSAFASQETICYEASIYIDGVRVGTVDNDGRGGSDNVHPWEVAERIDEYAKTLPKFTCEWIDPATGKPGEIHQNHEIIFGELMNDHLIKKDLKRFLASKILYTSDGKLYATNAKSAAELKAALAKSDLKQQLKADVILNLLPFDEALQTFRSF
jgi:hypothetical protein